MVGHYRCQKDAKWNVKTEVKTLTISCTANGGANVSFVNPSNGQVLDQPIAYDTGVGIKIDGYANGKGDCIGGMYR